MSIDVPLSTQRGAAAIPIIYIRCRAAPRFFFHTYIYGVTQGVALRAMCHVNGHGTTNRAARSRDTYYMPSPSGKKSAVPQKGRPTAKWKVKSREKRGWKMG